MNAKILFTLICLLGATAANAQHNVVAKYSVAHNYGREMTLVCNPERSLYFNTMSQYVDSCESTPEGKARLHEIQMKAWRVVQPYGTVTYDGRKLGLAPEKIITLYVEKDNVKGQLSLYDHMAGGLYRYEEPLDEMTWEIADDSTATILGHECIMAVSRYHGREWKAWFAPGIPVSDGPWKLRGLPGLILRADGGDGFTIEATEVGITGIPVPRVYSTNLYERCGRRQILADHEHYENNFESIMAAEGVKLNGDGSPANLPQYDRQTMAWETDY